MAERDRATAPFGQGRRLYEIRMHRGMSQGLLARAIGVSTGTIQNYEKGRAPMTLQRVEQLASALNVQPADLFAASGSALPKFRFQGDRVLLLPQLINPNVWPNGCGFYGRAPVITGTAPPIVDVDRATLAACGLAPNAPGAIAWLDWMKRIHADDRAAVQRELVLLDTTDVFALQYRLRGWDGVERSIVDCSRMARDELGRATRLQGMFLDVTQARRTAEAERTIKQIFRTFRRN